MTVDLGQSHQLEKGHISAHPGHWKQENTFLAKLWRYILLSLHCTLHCTCVSTLMPVWGHAARLRVRSLWYKYAMLRNNPGNARACPGLQVPMVQWLLHL